MTAGLTKPDEKVYFNIDYNGFDNQLYHKMQIICEKGATCKKKQGDFNLALESRDWEGDRITAIFINLY
jgi:hypothetical protein